MYFYRWQRAQTLQVCIVPKTKSQWSRSQPALQGQDAANISSNLEQGTAFHILHTFEKPSSNCRVYARWRLRFVSNRTEFWIAYWLCGHGHCSWQQANRQSQQSINDIKICLSHYRKQRQPVCLNLCCRLWLIQEHIFRFVWDPFTSQIDGNPEWKLFTGEKATKWETSEHCVDGLTTNGVLIMSPNGTFCPGDFEPKSQTGEAPGSDNGGSNGATTKPGLWREVSVSLDLKTVHMAGENWWLFTGWWRCVWVERIPKRGCPRATGSDRKQRFKRRNVDRPLRSDSSVEICRWIVTISNS